MKEKDTPPTPGEPLSTLPEGYEEYRDALAVEFETSGIDPLEAQIYLDIYAFTVRRCGFSPEDAYNDVLGKYEDDRDTKRRGVIPQQNPLAAVGRKALSLVSSRFS